MTPIVALAEMIGKPCSLPQRLWVFIGMTFLFSDTARSCALVRKAAMRFGLTSLTGLLTSGLNQTSFGSLEQTSLIRCSGSGSGSSRIRLARNTRIQVLPDLG